MRERMTMPLLSLPKKRKRLLLSEREFIRRARRIRLVLTDNDGVLTDTGIYYGADGELFRRYSIRDGMGFELLRKAGIEAGIMTGEPSENVRSRARKLRLTHCYLGVNDKKAELVSVLAEHSLKPEEVAFVGDDVNDEHVLRFLNPAGLTAAPSDAVPLITGIVHYLCREGGGRGAFREFAELLLHARSRRA